MTGQLRECIMELPWPNRAMLRLLLEHLAKIAANASENMMHPSNLGVVFGPTLLRRPNADDEAASVQASIADVPACTHVVESLVSGFAELSKARSLASGGGGGGATSSYERRRSKRPPSILAAAAAMDQAEKVRAISKVAGSVFECAAIAKAGAAEGRHERAPDDEEGRVGGDQRKHGARGLQAPSSPPQFILEAGVPRATAASSSTILTKNAPPSPGAAMQSDHRASISSIASIGSLRGFEDVATASPASSVCVIEMCNRTSAQPETAYTNALDHAYTAGVNAVLPASSGAAAAGSLDGNNLSSETVAQPPPPPSPSPPSSSLPRQGSSSVGSQGSTTPSSVLGSNMMGVDWFVGVRQKRACESAVLASGEGSFLVRQTKKELKYTVMVNTAGKAQGFSIDVSEDGAFSFASRGPFQSLQEVIDMLKRTPIRSHPGDPGSIICRYTAHLAPRSSKTSSMLGMQIATDATDATISTDATDAAAVLHVQTQDTATVAMPAGEMSSIVQSDAGPAPAPAPATEVEPDLDTFVEVQRRPKRKESTYSGFRNSRPGSELVEGFGALSDDDYNEEDDENDDNDNSSNGNGDDDGSSELDVVRRPRPSNKSSSSSGSPSKRASVYDGFGTSNAAEESDDDDGGGGGGSVVGGDDDGAVQFRDKSGQDAFKRDASSTSIYGFDHLNDFNEDEESDE